MAFIDKIVHGGPILKVAKANSFSALCRAIQTYPREINAREPNRGRTALMICSSHGSGPAVRELLQRWANPMLASRDDQKIALHYAVMSGSLECCKALLLQTNCPVQQVHCRDKWGKVPLDYCLVRHAEIACMLCHFCAAPLGRRREEDRRRRIPDPGPVTIYPGGAHGGRHDAPQDSAYQPDTKTLRKPSPLAAIPARPLPIQSYPAIPQIRPQPPGIMPTRPSSLELLQEIQILRQMRKHGWEQREMERIESMLGRKYTTAELLQGTDYLSDGNMLGTGGFGKVYKGSLDGTRVAIKVMDDSPEAMQGIKEFAKEMTILSRTRHPHIVLLMGACMEPGMRALVYELAEGGSLDDHMFRRKQNCIPLSWKDRIRITAEVAAALVFLHSLQPSPIAHMDVKPANVLLTRNLEVKLGDVGLARIMQRPPGAPPAEMCEASVLQASELVGTPTYVDPEYLQTGGFSRSSDVYALGMVMLQLLTGISTNAVVNRVRGARGYLAQFWEVLDPILKHAQPSLETVHDMMVYAELALRCLELRQTDRPDIRSWVLPILDQLRRRASSSI